jgi:stage II sporulation protein D
MRRLAILTALCACLAMPAVASASTVYVTQGRGFGHGIGMSQYGAQGFAQNGWSYRRILAHYYRGTTVGTAATGTVRVLLRSGAGSLAVSHVSKAGSKRLNPLYTYLARVRGSGIVLRGPGGRVARSSGPLRLIGPAGYTVLGSGYRGAMELRPGGGGVMAINVVSLDEYVQGVIPGEMPSTWEPEALKAQAVAARSYALTSDAGGALFDHYADTRSQMYGGMLVERASTNAAARATARQVVLYRGAVASTYYFSTSGGHTENVENVWYGASAISYLRGVDDPYDGASPRHRWQLRFAPERIQARLGRLCLGRFRAIKVVRRGASPRVVAADVVCSGGRVRTTGAALRSALGLHDTWFSVTRASAAAAKRSPDLNVPIVSSFVNPRTIEGSFSPVPAGGYVNVERLEGARWQLVARGLTNRLGAYSVPVYAGGTYRVSAGDVSADPVALR